MGEVEAIEFTTYAAWLSDLSMKCTSCGGLKMKKNKVTIKTGSTDEFFHRVRGRAEKLDRGESLPAEMTISFEDPMELISILTSERVRLLRRAKGDRCPYLRPMVSSETFARLAEMWLFSKRRAYCEPAIARIRDTAGSRSSKLLREDTG